MTREQHLQTAQYHRDAAMDALKKLGGGYIESLMQCGQGNIIVNIDKWRTRK